MLSQIYASCLKRNISLFVISTTLLKFPSCVLFRRNIPCITIRISNKTLSNKTLRVHYIVEYFHLVNYQIRYMKSGKFPNIIFHVFDKFSNLIFGVMNKFSIPKLPILKVKYFKFYELLTIFAKCQGLYIKKLYKINFCFIKICILKN